MTGQQGSTAESIVREIKRQTRRKFTAEEKIRIVLEGLRGEAGITDLYRKEGIHPTMYYKWSKGFLEAGKRQLNGDTIREAGSRNGLKIPTTPRTSSCSARGCSPEPGQGSEDQKKILAVAILDR
jgi:transposase